MYQGSSGFITIQLKEPILVSEVRLGHLVRYKIAAPLKFFSLLFSLSHEVVGKDAESSPREIEIFGKLSFTDENT
jgi:hypothetical protein